MRVTEGEYHNLPLQSLSAKDVRPTTRRVREALFEFLEVHLPGARMLDLCAGSGAVGIEALSRGAQHVTFVERAPDMCRMIEANLGACGVKAYQADVLRDEATGFLRRFAAQPGLTWDIVFYDPPYESDYAPVLDFFGRGTLLKRKGGIFVAEHHCDNPLGEALGVLRRWRLVRRGDCCLSFYERRR